mmetsp:Transcript_27875/g.24518  ORF Transcript_27875/g.24518 Transcript_27875/m.24518 type:complete len:88 (-) Transcript_27875:1162-1425(-)
MKSIPRVSREPGAVFNEIPGQTGSSCTISLSKKQSPKGSPKASYPSPERALSPEMLDSGSKIKNNMSNPLLKKMSAGTVSAKENTAP